MKNSALLLILSAIGLLATGCGSDADKNVISQRYIHKYGYDVSRDEWKTQKYPGQVVTTKQNGQTITETYEDGLLHGPRTETYAHSQTVQLLEHYERGVLAKRVHYGVRGVPHKEELFKSPTHLLVTTWYPSGTPRSKEEFRDNVLTSGHYFNTANETDSRIDNGTGERTVRNQNGDVLSKEVFNNFALTYVETYYPNNTPHTITSYENGLVHGEVRNFAMTGEPLSVEHYYKGKKHGLATYYQNGYKYLEVPYQQGLKEGIERQFIDGETTTAETEYHYDMKHGPSIVYCDGSARTTWFYNNDRVTKAKFEEMADRYEFIATIHQ